MHEWMDNYLKVYLIPMRLNIDKMLTWFDWCQIHIHQISGWIGLSLHSVGSKYSTEKMNELIHNIHQMLTLHTIIAAILGPSKIQYEGSKLYPIPQDVESALSSYNFVITQAKVKGIGNTEKQKLFLSMMYSYLVRP